MASASEQAQPVQPQLGLWDAVSIIIGIVVGAGIYETPPLVFNNVSGPGVAIGLWALAGLLSLIGALCYAELATTYPRSGGDYVYLTRAYGPLVGFVFGWGQLAVVLTANIGMMAYIFADYAVQLFDFEYARFAYAATAVILLTLLNVLGVVLGKAAQNVLSAAKVLGLIGIVIAGFCYAPTATTAPAAPTAEMTWQGIALAMVLVFLTYGGWNDAAFVAAELRQRRNIARALIVGTLTITAIYLLVNGAYLWCLGFEGARQSKAIATEAVKVTLGDQWARAISGLVMISALGAANGLIFTGSRIYATLGADYGIFARLGRWDRRRGSPVASLLTQAAIALGMIVLVGTPAGQDAANRFFEMLGLEKAKWEGRSGFDTLLKCTAPVFWIFFALTALSLFNLRINDRDTPRPFAVPLFPVVPLVFLLTCCYMVYSSVQYAGAFGLVGGSILLLGLPLFALSPRRKSAQVAYLPDSSPEYP
jgi:basic amino acid/polyamine antiporter, APA family